MNKLILVCVVSLWGCLLYGHGELEKRIKDVSIQILNDPTNSSLFFKRGTLYYQHEEYQKSIEDYRICLDRNYLSDQLYLSFANSFLKSQELDSSLFYSHKILDHTPHHVLALKAKAKALFQQENYKSAAKHFQLVILHVDKPTSDNYFDAVSAYQSCGTESCFNSAILMLEEGINKLGPLLVFHKKMVELYSQVGKLEEALQIQEIIISQSHRKERPIFEKAKLLLRFDKKQKAESSFKEALVALDQLPARISQNNASKQLRIEILTQIANTKKLE